MKPTNNKVSRKSGPDGKRRAGAAKLHAVILATGLALLSYGFVGAGQKAGQSQAERLFARAKAEDYMGGSGCADCHETKVSEFSHSGHAAFVSDPNLPQDKRGCEGCHGPGNIHQDENNPEVISFTKMSPKESSAACLRCHGQTMSPSHWKLTEHSRADLSCVSCHQIHTDTVPDFGKAVRKGQAKDPRTAAFVAKANPKAMLKADEATLCGSCHPGALGEFRNAVHHPVPEGSMSCSDCHTAHPSKSAKNMAGGLKDACVKCHTEFAGPFVFEHDPVAGFSGDGCKECHKPHGSNSPNMLNSNSRGLCAQCHTDKLGTHYPNQTCWTSGCHVATHGSNSDPRFLSH